MGARGRQRQVRNQAHGAPANLLDLYAASDIPETEGAEIQRFKWATSAAHVAGRPLVSAEAATWLGEHFRSTLADVRANVDRFFVAGVNHIFYHGTAYSPVGEAWPGWQFYAAVEFSPQNAWWDDFGTLNRYVTRVQSFLQAGTPDHDVAAVLPVLRSADCARQRALDALWRCEPSGTGHGVRRGSRPASARRLHLRLHLRSPDPRGPRLDGGRLLTSAGRPIASVVLPAARYIPLPTFEHVLALARSGATVVSSGDWPSDIAGLARTSSPGARVSGTRSPASRSVQPAPTASARRQSAGTHSPWRRRGAPARTRGR